MADAELASPADDDSTRRMTPGRLKLLTLAVLVVLDGVAILAGTQLWFTVVADGREIPVDGAIAAGALVPLALAGLVLVPALAIAGPAFRAILSVLQAVLGACIVLQAALAIGDPAAASSAAVADATGVGGGSAAAELVESAVSSAWPPVALTVGIVLAIAGVTTLVTSRGWPRSGRKYERTRLEAADGTPTSAVDEWDALSHGDDPTR